MDKFKATSCLLFLALLILLAPSARADSLGPDLSTFATLGGAGVAINGTGSVIDGSVGGCCNATAVTGVIPTNFNISGGTVQMGGATATLAQGELGTAITTLSGLGPGSPESLLGGLTLGPGVYSSSSTMGLTGSLTLNGGGNANAQWVFIVGSSLTTASASVVNVINTGSGARVYWVIGAGSAVLGSDSTFMGNILANESISLGTNVTDPCGRLLTQVASVTLAGDDNIGIGCQNISSGSLVGSNGLNGGSTTGGGGGGTGGGPSPVPEPGTLLLLSTGIVGLVSKARMRRRTAAAE